MRKRFYDYTFVGQNNGDIQAVFYFVDPPLVLSLKLEYYKNWYPGDTHPNTIVFSKVVPDKVFNMGSEFVQKYIDQHSITMTTVRL